VLLQVQGAFQGYPMMISPECRYTQLCFGVHKVRMISFSDHYALVFVFLSSVQNARSLLPSGPLKQRGPRTPHLVFIHCQGTKWRSHPMSATSDRTGTEYVGHHVPRMSSDVPPVPFHAPPHPPRSGTRRSEPPIRRCCGHYRRAINFHDQISRNKRHMCSH